MGSGPTALSGVVFGALGGTAFQGAIFARHAIVGAS